MIGSECMLYPILVLCESECLNALFLESALNIIDVRANQSCSIGTWGGANMQFLV